MTSRIGTWKERRSAVTACPSGGERIHMVGGGVEVRANLDVNECTT